MFTLNRPLYTLVLILYVFAELSFAQSDQKTLPDAVIQEMTKRETRYHHFIWHNVRENWNKLSSSAKQEIRDLGWAPPHPARRYEGDTAIAITDNLSGEDFLFMHRQMINQVNDILATNGGSYGNKVIGWTSVPAPDDSTWPVPDDYTITGQPSKTETVNEWKTRDFYNSNIKPNEDKFKDPSELRRMSLAELGARIEVTVHGYMHIRFSSNSSYGYRPGTSNALPDIDEKWDDPQYDWLADIYSSVVNPIFWKLHGWVDDRVEDWRKANGLSSIRWGSSWVGGPMSNIGYLWDKKEGAKTSLRVPDQEKGHMEGMDDTMKKVGLIFAREGLEASFTDVVLLDTPKKFKSKTKRRLCKAKPKKFSSR